MILQVAENRKKKLWECIVKNPVCYFEIPVNDIERAIAFYNAVFDYQFERADIDGNEMALFPAFDKGSGITGALTDTGVK